MRWLYLPPRWKKHCLALTHTHTVWRKFEFAYLHNCALQEACWYLVTCPLAMLREIFTVSLNKYPRVQWKMLNALHHFQGHAKKDGTVFSMFVLSHYSDIQAFLYDYYWLVRLKLMYFFPLFLFFWKYAIASQLSLCVFFPLSLIGFCSVQLYGVSDPPWPTWKVVFLNPKTPGIPQKRRLRYLWLECNSSMFNIAAFYQHNWSW